MEEQAKADEAKRAAQAKADEAKREQAARLGRWSNTVEKDSMSDFQNSTWTSPAQKNIPNSIGSPVRPSLIVRCKDKKTEVIVHWARFVTTGGLDHAHTVRTRVGDAPADEHTLREHIC